MRQRGVLLLLFIYLSVTYKKYKYLINKKNIFYLFLFFFFFLLIKYIFILYGVRGERPASYRNKVKKSIHQTSKTHTKRKYTQNTKH